MTLRQVADEAGVSPGTASRALRGHPQVSADCVATVRAAAERLGYMPLRDRTKAAKHQPLVDRVVEGLGRRGAAHERTTAIYCPADSIAALVYRALATRGLVPGRDIALVSCNHERALVAGLWPTLATVDVRPQRIGRLAVEQLARLITGEFVEAEVQIGVEPVFVPGGSIGRCRAKPSRGPHKIK